MIKDCHVGVKGVVRVGDSVLVLKKGEGDTSYWDIPGGRIDGEESLTETLTRELSEELPSLGTYTIGDVLDAYRLSKNIIDDRALVLVFYTINAESFEVLLSDEHSGYRWVTNDTVAELLTTETKIEKGYYNALTRALALG